MKKVMRGLFSIGAFLLLIGVLFGIVNEFSENSLYETIHKWGMIIGFSILVLWWLILIFLTLGDHY